MSIISKAMFSATVVSDRIDPEFFDPTDLEISQKLEKEGAKPLDEWCFVYNGKTPGEYFQDGDTPFVRSGDLIAPLIYPKCGPEFLLANKTPQTFFLQTGDVLISSIGMGSIGKISLVMDASNFATVSEVTVLRSKGYPPEVMFTYLTTQTGQRQICRQITGATGQQHLLKSKVKTILVPPPPKKSVCDAIRKSCNQAWEFEVSANQQHTNTHSIFAQTFGLK